MTTIRICTALLFLMSAASAAANRQTVLTHYLTAAQETPSAERGRSLWNRSGIRGRNCTQCHGRDLRRPGRHRRTHKPIAPMAPSVNPKRLTDPKKVEKWFRRNCKWTWGRECTAQEKADILQWLNTL